MSQTQEQQRFTISKVAVDWHELMILQRIMRPIDHESNTLPLETLHSLYSVLHAW